MDGQTFRLQKNFFGLTTREIAASLGVTEKTVRNWENGPQMVSSVASGYMRDRLSDLEKCMKLFSGKETKMLTYCPSLDDLHFFYEHSHSLQIIAVYWHALGRVSAEEGKDVSLLSIKGYRYWLDGKEDTFESRDEYKKGVELGLIQEKKDKRQKRVHLLAQCSLLDFGK